MEKDESIPGVPYRLIRSEYPRDVVEQAVFHAAMTSEDNQEIRDAESLDVCVRG